jgi:hypothetical protein
MTDLPSTAALDELFAAERELPIVLESATVRVWERLCRTFGWSTPGGAGGGSLAGHAAMLVVLALASFGAVAYLMASGRTAPGSRFAPPADAAAEVASGVHGRGATSAPDPFAEPDRPARGIRGIVVHRGAPVAGARVVLTGYATRAGLAAATEVRSGSDGRFDLGVRPAATYDLAAVAAARGIAHARVDARDPTARLDDVVLDLPGCAHVLYGEVRDVSGGSVAGAHVEPTRGRWADTTSIGAGAVTDEHGRYELCTRAGSITVLVAATGYGALTVDEEVLGRRRLDVDLVPEVVVAGRTVDAATGAPVANATVWLSPAEWPQKFHTATAVTVSGADGRFRIGGVAPGRHGLWAERDGAGAWMQITAVVGDSSELVARLARRATVRGRVLAGGVPVPGARIALTRNGRRANTPVAADYDGRFELTTGLDSVIGFDVVGYRVIAPGEQPVDAIVGAVDVRVAAGASVRGRVERGGRAVPYASISVSGPLPDTFDRPPPADANGEFVVAGLPAGQYLIGAASVDEQAFTTEAGSVRIEVADGEVREGVVLALDGAASISGRVVDQDGRGIADAFVQYVHEQTGDLCRAVTDLDGGFTCGMMTGSGTYRPVVRPTRVSEVHLPAAESGGLPAVALAGPDAHAGGQTLRVRFVRTRIAGRVLRSNGAPYPDVAVAALEASTGAPPANAYWARGTRVLTDADGRFSIEAWSDATYAVYARAPGGADASVRDVAAGAGDVVIRLDDAGEIRGTVSGFSTRPTILARRLGDPDQAFWASGEGDAFVVGHLAPARYVVYATEGAEAATAVVEVAAGGSSTVALAARPRGAIAARVIDFTTGAPVAGVRCSAAPYHPGAGVFGWGNAAPASDTDGRFTVASTTGIVEVTCLAAQSRWSEGAAQVEVAAGATAELAVAIVVDGSGWRGIGALVEMRQLEPMGFGHVVVELRPDGAAAQGGIRVGDAIRAIDGRDISVLTDHGLAALLASHDLGATIQITVDRGGEQRVVAVTIEGAWER